MPSMSAGTAMPPSIVTVPVFLISVRSGHCSWALATPIAALSSPGVMVHAPGSG